MLGITTLVRLLTYESMLIAGRLMEGFNGYS